MFSVYLWGDEFYIVVNSVKIFEIPINSHKLSSTLLLQEVIENTFKSKFCTFKWCNQTCSLIINYQITFTTLNVKYWLITSSWYKDWYNKIQLRLFLHLPLIITLLEVHIGTTIGGYNLYLYILIFKSLVYTFSNRLFKLELCGFFNVAFFHPCLNQNPCLYFLLIRYCVINCLCF